jgi:hypothetical protein
MRPSLFGRGGRLPSMLANSFHVVKSPDGCVADDVFISVGSTPTGQSMAVRVETVPNSSTTLVGPIARSASFTDISSSLPDAISNPERRSCSTMRPLIIPIKNLVNAVLPVAGAASTSDVGSIPDRKGGEAVNLDRPLPPLHKSRTGSSPFRVAIQGCHSGLAARQSEADETRNRILVAGE